MSTQGNSPGKAAFTLLITFALALLLASCGGANGGAAGAPAGGAAPATAPALSLIASPAIGDAPLTVALGAAFLDGNVTDATYEWSYDFDGDGVIDTVIDGPSGPNLQLTFKQKGSYKVHLRVDGHDANGNPFSTSKDITIEVK